MFAHVARQIELGIDTRHLCVRYGGELEALAALPGYAVLRDVAARHGIELLASVMSVAAAVNVGVGCVSVRSEDHTSELQSLMRISYAVFCLKKNRSSLPPIRATLRLPLIHRPRSCSQTSTLQAHIHTSYD